jgi:glutamate carboxypeptidase
MEPGVLSDQLNWIDDRRDEMIELLVRWSGINSGTHHAAGLAAMRQELHDAFAPLADAGEEVALPPARTVDSSGAEIEAPLGPALRFVRRAGAPIRVLLNIHYDTVFGQSDAFQRARRIDEWTLNGPGVADAKGGILVMLTALRALERTAAAAAGRIGWEVILNSDEEIGSPGSAKLLAEAAARNHLGLVFEPAFPDGALAGARKGSGTIAAVVRGRAAHAGRDFSRGRSAILALAELITRLRPADDRPGVIINCGRIEGGGAVNIVPDLAIGRFNVRADSSDDQAWIEAHFRAVAREVERTADGIRVELHGGFNSPPKPMDPRSAALMGHVLSTGRELGMDLSYRPSGGTCDGNKLAAAGLPVVDSLGPVGGELHSDREYVRLDTLTQRAKLVALLLMKLAAGELAVP